MSCSKPLQPFVCDSLYYLNRDQLELFSIICRPLKNFIDRYFHSKPYRVFDRLKINAGMYALIHNGVRWYPNRDDYSVQQFLEIRHILQSHSIELILPKSLLMSCSKPLQPFVCDSLYYLNRNQLELFSIICRPLKNFIDRYLHTKPYRIFDELRINDGSYALIHNGMRWHPNRADYSVQQFLAGQFLQVEYFSFAEMRPYLSSTVRIEHTTIFVNGEDIIYSPKHIKEMESLAYLWSNHKIWILKNGGSDFQIDDKDFQPILDSPIILQCQELSMTSPYISFIDYNVLYAVKVFEIQYNDKSFDKPEYLAEFLEQPRLKPIINLHISGNKIIDSLFDRLSKDFFSADSPNSFKIVIHFDCVTEFDPLKEFLETNNISGEKLELKKGLPAGYQMEDWEEDVYTLERSMI